MHAYSPECNVVEGFEGFDSQIAFLASVEAWIILLPALYEISKVLVPGIPQSMIAIDDEDVKNEPQSSYLHFLKYVTVISPDLVLSASCGTSPSKGNLPNLTSNTKWP